MNQPLISILIPAYNVSNYIEDCLDSIINQTYKNIEIIVINDGSTDNTYDLLKKYKHSIRLYNQNNKGVSFTRNKLISLLTGNYFMFVDADDTIRPETCNTLIELLLKDDLDILFFNMYRDDLNPTRTDSFYRIKNDYLIKATNSIRQKWKYQIYANTPCCKIYKKYLSQYIHFEGASSEDFYFSYKPYSFVNKAGYLDSSLYYYRNNESSLTHNHNQYNLNPFIFKCWCQRALFYENRKEYKYSIPCIQHASSLLFQLIKEGRKVDKDSLDVYLDTKKYKLSVPIYSIKNYVLSKLIKKRIKQGGSNYQVYK